MADGNNCAPLPEAHLIVGGARTGKTHTLIDAVSKCVAHDSSAIVFCSNPFAEQTFKKRLIDSIGADAAAHVRIITPRAFALEVLSSDEAKTTYGREARILTKTEGTFLKEDMKVSGLRTKRLREMMKFFYRSFTEMTDDTEGEWLITVEETQIYDLLKDNLKFVQSYLECEVSACAYRLLESDESVRARFTYDQVFVDDYQQISRASQKLACIIATRALTVAADTNTCVEVYESYPYAAGVAEFEESYPQAVRTELTESFQPQELSSALTRLLADEEVDTSALPEKTKAFASTESDIDTAAIKVITKETAAAEIGAVAQYVASRLDAGADASSIVVATPNNTWTKNVCAALKQVGVNYYNPFANSGAAKGDIRMFAYCTNARVITLLNLVADPDCAPAWRDWSGYGDWLVCSGAFAALRDIAAAHEMTLPEVLAYASENPDSPDFKEHIVGLSQVLEAYRVASKKIEKLHAMSNPLAGKALLDELTIFATGGEASEASASLVNACVVDAGAGDNAQVNSAAAMTERVRKNLSEPALDNRADAVLVIPYKNVVGIDCDTLVVTGFVNGFIPSRDYFDTTIATIDKQGKMHAEDTQRVYNLVGLAHKTLVLSRFTSIELENAERLKLKIDRIRMKDGERMCTIAPSDFLKIITGVE